jgi:hypothetical protein
VHNEHAGNEFLDDQLFGTFARCKDLLRQDPVQAQDRADLRAKLQVAAGVVVFIGIFEAVDVRDVSDDSARPEPALRVRSRKSIGIEGELGRQDLQRDVAIQFRVARAIHLAHAAEATQAGNLVRADACPAIESHSSSFWLLRSSHWLARTSCDTRSSDSSIGI